MRVGGGDTYVCVFVCVCACLLTASVGGWPWVVRVHARPVVCPCANWCARKFDRVLLVCLHVWVCASGSVCSFACCVCGASSRACIRLWRLCVHAGAGQCAGHPPGNQTPVLVGVHPQEQTLGRLIMVVRWLYPSVMTPNRSPECAQHRALSIDNLLYIFEICLEPSYFPGWACRGRSGLLNVPPVWPSIYLCCWLIYIFFFYIQW